MWPTTSMMLRVRCGSRLFRMSMRMCSLASSVHGEQSRNTALNSTHCSSSQEFDEVSNTLRTRGVDRGHQHGPQQQPRHALADPGGDGVDNLRRRQQRLENRVERAHFVSPLWPRGELRPAVILLLVLLRCPQRPGLAAGPATLIRWRYQASRRSWSHGEGRIWAEIRGPDPQWAAKPMVNGC